MIRSVFLLIATFACISPALCRGDFERFRVVIESDAGGDPDDEQSLVRWILYANEWDVEAIIANRAAAREGENRNRERTGLGIVQHLVHAYGESYPRLVEHDPRYPKPEALLAKVVAGYDDRDDAVKRLISILDSPDQRPVFYADWGSDRGAGINNLRRALDRILKERGQEGYAQVKRKLRVFGYPEIFGDHATKLAPPFPLLVNTFQPPQDGLRWYHRFSAITAKAGGFNLQRDVIFNHGPIGALYPTNTTHGQKEGDTMTFLSWIPTGLSDPAKPEWGSWAGRYGLNPDSGDWPIHWANQADTWEGSTHRDNTLKRWAVALQNDFRARMEWCVKPRAEGNHPPQPRLKDQPDTGILHLQLRAGAQIEFDASPSIDPDGQALTFDWIVYPEPGSYRGAVHLTSTKGQQTAVDIPGDSTNKTIHLILSATDSGTPALTRYRRIILEPTP